ncbi:chromosome partitioning protein ParB [uncultured Alistipes sp.]|uniref:chromosome partitioning protein ParB n=1 Tax=uncultured Alistipes sp. TaxID=538949 RepID=UPI00266F5DCC|nr:chromosome partitioning protein ParB [uncultured Alistipes sp.]
MARGEAYEEFVEKFRPTKTTDDCYTPPAVYDAALAWVRRNCDIEGARIVRPFYPGGDYENYPYREGDVVIDNPPFSIVSKITLFYLSKGVRFFLFAPHLTVFSPARECTAVVPGASVTYENGAVVRTSFVSNLFGDVAAMSAPDLGQAIEEAQAREDRSLPRYVYPVHVLRACDLGRFSKCGVRYVVRRSSAQHIARLESQGKRASIYGGGLLLSAAAAADRERADRERAERQTATAWPLGETEWNIIKTLE